MHSVPLAVSLGHQGDLSLNLTVKMSTVSGGASENLPVDAGDIRVIGSVPGLGRRSPEGGNGNSLQYSCLENCMNRGACWATVHRVSKSQT